MMTIGGIAHTEPGSAQQNPAGFFTTRNALRDLVGKSGIIHRLGAVGAQVEWFVAELLQLLDKPFLHVEAGMIGGDRDGFAMRII